MLSYSLLVINRLIVCYLQGFFWGIKGLILRAESIILKIKHYTKDYYYRVRCASVAFCLLPVLLWKGIMFWLWFFFCLPSYHLNVRLFVCCLAFFYCFHRWYYEQSAKYWIGKNQVHWTYCTNYHSINYNISKHLRFSFIFFTKLYWIKC